MVTLFVSSGNADLSAYCPICLGQGCDYEGSSSRKPSSEGKQLGLFTQSFMHSFGKHILGTCTRHHIHTHHPMASEGKPDTKLNITQTNNYWGEGSDMRAQWSGAILAKGQKSFP